MVKLAWLNDEDVLQVLEVFPPEMRAARRLLIGQCPSPYNVEGGDDVYDNVKRGYMYVDKMMAQLGVRSSY